MVISLIATFAKRVGAVCVAFVVCWHVIHLIGPREGTAVVRVTEPGAVVTIDHVSYPPSTSAESSVVAHLGPGRHLLQINHGELVLVEQSFTVESGQELVLNPLRPNPGAPAVSNGSDVQPKPRKSARREPLAINVLHGQATASQ